MVLLYNKTVEIVTRGRQVSADDVEKVLHSKCSLYRGKFDEVEKLIDTLVATNICKYAMVCDLHDTGTIFMFFKSKHDADLCLFKLYGEGHYDAGCDNVAGWAMVHK